MRQRLMATLSGVLLESMTALLASYITPVLMLMPLLLLMLSLWHRMQSLLHAGV